MQKLSVCCLHLSPNLDAEVCCTELFSVLKKTLIIDRASGCEGFGYPVIQPTQCVNLAQGHGSVRCFAHDDDDDEEEDEDYDSDDDDDDDDDDEDD